jgi:hypothetical protein
VNLQPLPRSPDVQRATALSVSVQHWRALILRANGRVWRNLDTLALLTGYARSHVARYVQHLVSDGELDESDREGVAFYRQSTPAPARQGKRLVPRHGMGRRRG